MPPTQEMSDARQSVEAAKLAGASEHAPQAIDSAEQLLSKAEARMREGAYEEAQQDALAAKEAARHALALAASRQQTPSSPPESFPQPPSSAAAESPAAIVRHAVHVVAAGESLWRIAGKVYGDPLLWPLLFERNQPDIHDADLIHPGQRLRYDPAPSEAERRTAARHARHRGAWRLGVREASDAAYLARP